MVKVLVFNCGSSSLKFALLELDGEGSAPQEIARGEFEEIGDKGNRFAFEFAGHKSVGARSSPQDHASAAAMALDLLEAHGQEPRGIAAVAHRVVHGGARIAAPTLADGEVLRLLEEAGEFAPLHNPPALATIRAVGDRLRETPAVVVTDTAFYQALPDFARTYAIAGELTARYGIRRFGFHGIGHAWMMERCAELSGKASERLNLITVQLGAGCSATAIRDGRAVDTSMGFTPLEGLMMATRSGDLDPALVTYLGRRGAMSGEEIETMLNRKSGLLGVSGLSADMREVLEASRTGDERASLAVGMFCYRVRKYIGAYLAIPGRTEAVIFGGGIGEHSDEIRARICKDLEPLGVALDERANRAANGREARFSAPDSPVKLQVIPLQEEIYMARAAARLVSAGNRGKAGRKD